MSLFKKKVEYEPEYQPTTPPVDKIYELDGRGNLIEVEVADDVGDD